MKITKTMLKRKGACPKQLDKFIELFPKGTEVTEALCVEHAQTFDWSWAAGHLLSAPAWAEYDKACASEFAHLWIEENSK